MSGSSIIVAKVSTPTVYSELQPLMVGLVCIAAPAHGAATQTLATRGWGERLIAAINRNQQAQDKDKQVDVSQVHRQRCWQVLVVAVGAGQNVEIHHGTSGK